MGKALINGDVHGKSSINGAFDGTFVRKYPEICGTPTKEGDFNG